MDSERLRTGDVLIWVSRPIPSTITIVVSDPFLRSCSYRGEVVLVILNDDLTPRSVSVDGRRWMDNRWEML